MLQREVATRLLARPGDQLYSRLSVNAQFFSRISHVMKVGRNNFVPPPQVESSVVRIEPKRGKDRPAINWDELDGLLRICFTRKHKTFRAILRLSKIRAMIESNWITWATMYPDQVSSNDIHILLAKDFATEYADQGLIDDPDWDNEGSGEEDGLGATTGKRLNSSELLNIGTNRVPRPAVEQLIRLKIDRVLELTKLADARAATCSETDFLRLLHGFHIEHIYFA